MHTAGTTPASAAALAFGLITSVAGGQMVLYVDDDAPLGGDGASWNTAYRHLQDALLGAALDSDIRIAGGIYSPDEDEGSGVTPGDRTATSQLISGVGLYGGYRGCPAGNCASGDPDERDIVVYETRLTGDLSGDDVADLEGFVGRFSGDGTPYGSACASFDLDADGDVDIADGHIGENAYHVLTGSGTNATAILDGLKMTAWNADRPTLDLNVSGSGM